MTPDEIAAIVADCDACDGTGTIQDELQSAMGGTPWNDCMTCYKVRALAAELDHRDLVHVNEVIALQRAVDGRGETIDSLEAQLEAVTRERHAAVNDANRQKYQHERLRVSFAVALGLLSEMEYWRQLTGTRFEAPLRNFLADMRAGR